MYNTLPSYRTMMDKEGVAGPADLAIAGTAAEVRDRLAELSAIGVNDFNAAIGAADPSPPAAKSLPPLTRRQRAVAELIATGATNKHIAAKSKTTSSQ